MCQTTHLSIKSVYKTLRRRADVDYMPMAITFAAFAVGSAASTTCVNLQVCRVSVFLCAGVVGQGRPPSDDLYTVRLRIASTDTWEFVNSTRANCFRMEMLHMAAYITVCYIFCNAKPHRSFSHVTNSYIILDLILEILFFDCSIPNGVVCVFLTI